VDYLALPPVPARADRALVPARSLGGIPSVASNFLAKMAGPTRRNLEPRKGANGKGLAPLTRLQQTGIAERPASRQNLMNMMALKQLVERDDIMYAIRSTIRRAIGEMKWKVVPDLDAIKADLERWENVVLVNLALPGFQIEFQPQAMSMSIYERATGALKDVLREVIKDGEEPATSPKIRNFFENVVAAHDAIAKSHIEEVERVFRTPNLTQNTFREFMDLIVDDITLFDAGVIVKNPTLDGKLGEIYQLPGYQVRPYRAKDMSIPLPPGVAYDWVVDSTIRAYFNMAEICYIMCNPQENGYGKSPAEALIDQMVGGVYADAYLVDAFANNNMPNFVFDLGPNVQEGERRAIEKAWDARVSQGLHRGIFVANAEGVKGFMPLQNGKDNDDTTIEKLKFWANRKCAAYGLGLSDIGFTEDLKAKATAEDQSNLSQTRGIDSFAIVIEEKLNVNIVRGNMWLREDPENTNSLAGRVVPCFPFKDVKIAFERGSKEDRLDKAEKAISLVSAGIFSINEERKELDMGPIPGGDVHVVFQGGSPMKVEDLPNIPAPQDPNAQQGGAPGQEAPGAPGQQDPTAQQPHSNGPPKPGQPKSPQQNDPDEGGDAVEKMNSIEHMARELAKLVVS
jgi:hypothetical protein